MEMYKGGEGIPHRSQGGVVIYSNLKLLSKLLITYQLCSTLLSAGSEKQGMEL